jgi:hypothetical protein
VLRRLRPALGQATQSFPVLKVEEETWSGDRMDFRVRALGQSVSGNVVVGETDVRLEVSLPWLLAKFAEQRKRVPGELAAPPHTHGSSLERLMAALSRYLFGAAGFLLAAMAAALVFYGALGVVQPTQRLDFAVLDAIGYMVIAIAVFDVSKYLLTRHANTRHMGANRRMHLVWRGIGIFADYR